MKFIVDVPDGMIHWDHHDYTDPEQMARLLRSHIAHMGAITVTPVEKGTQADGAVQPHGGTPKASGLQH